MSFYTHISNSLKNYPLHFLLLVFLLVHAVLYVKFGVYTEMEADKYVSQGKILYETGKFSEPKFIFYLPVILLVWVCEWFSLPLETVAFIQIVISGLAQFYFFKLIAELVSKPVAFITSLLLILFIPLQIWNLYLYTDSFFISFTLLYAWAIHKHARRGLTGKLIVLAFLALLVISRPHGLLFIPPTIIYFIIIAPTASAKLITTLVSAVLLFGMYIIMNRIFTGGSDMDALKPFVEEHIICFVPQKPEGAVLDIQHTESPVADLLYYVVNNPLHFTKLMVLRLYSFFNLTRPYYSFTHNLLLLVFMIPVYFLALVGIYKSWKRKRPFVFYLLLVLVLYPLGATFQCDDWHSRFTMVVIPIILLFAGIAIQSAINKKNEGVL